MLHSRKFFLNSFSHICNSATSISWMGHSLEVWRTFHRRCTVRGGNLGSFCHMLLSPLCMSCSMRRVGRSTGRSGGSRSQKGLHQEGRGTMGHNHSMGSCWHMLWLGSSVHQRHRLDHTLDRSFAQPCRIPLLQSFPGQCSSTWCWWLQQKYHFAKNEVLDSFKCGYINEFETSQILQSNLPKRWAKLDWFIWYLKLLGLQRHVY